MIYSRCAVPFSVDLLGDFLNYDFYTLHNHTESHKKSRPKNIVSKFRKVFRKNIFLKNFETFWTTFRNFLKIKILVAKSKFPKSEILKFQILEISIFRPEFWFSKIFEKCSKKSKNVRKICFRKTFRNFENIFFVQDFFRDSVWLRSV